ncbi:unnamed protein product [Strongylus vulgaris]|uniref:BPTI/Kunitz inhibitor domain-containing protein n=1 Tax=Strongylus vulgaris TaxID=40348 RepID=A0A3P7L0N8_STRVU|nr:unnamed protein product [Strongylus vulgaris]
MFYYDSAQKTLISEVCQPFMYNGCNGNGNRFDTAAECKQICIDGNGANAQQRDPSSDLHAAMKSACQAQYDTDHLTPQQCSNGQGCQNGYQCNSGFCCPTPRKNFSLNIDKLLKSYLLGYLCGLRYDSGKFAVNGEKSDRYFYTSQYKTCMR